MIVTVLLDCGDRLALATADEPPPLLSVKCRIYGDRVHRPCSGTTDDGTGRLCQCRCHGEPARVTYPLIVEHMIDPGDEMTCVICNQTREVVSLL